MPTQSMQPVTNLTAVNFIEINQIGANLQDDKEDSFDDFVAPEAQEQTQEKLDSYDDFDDF